MKKLTEEQISEGNILIQNFEYHFDKIKTLWSCNSLYYHVNYSWIMNVVEIINSLTPSEVVITSKHIYINTENNWNDFKENVKTNMVNDFSNYEIDVELEYGDSLLEGIWFAVVQYIKWYNKKNNL